MKKLLLSLTMLVSFIGHAQLAIETFSGATFPPTGWTTASTVATRPWVRSTTFTADLQTTFNINGPSAAINWIAAANDAHLTTPAFSLVGYGSANLIFNSKVGWSYMIDLDEGDFLVKVSIDGGTTWSTAIWTEDEGGWSDDGDGDEDTDLYDTQEISIDMAAYLGQANVKVRFQYVAANADAISIDDVRVVGLLSTNEFISAKFSTYPNPATNTVTISNKENIMVSEIAITDINGRVVKNLKVNNLSEVQMNVSELNSGVYFMNITTENGKAVKKFIKN